MNRKVSPKNKQNTSTSQNSTHDRAKMLVFLFFLSSISSVTGFEPQLCIRQRCTRCQTVIFERADSSREIDDVLVNKRRGPDLQKRGEAWDVGVEEIGASDEMKKAFEIHETPEKSPGYSSYATAIKNLSQLLDSNSFNLSKIKSLVSSLQQIETDDPSITKCVSPKVSKTLADALQKARAADTVHGPNSDQAAKAWDHVQLVSSRVPDVVANVLQDSKKNRYKESVVSSHHQYYTVVDPKSLEGALEAIGRLEHLMKQVKIESGRVTRSEYNAEDPRP